MKSLEIVTTPIILVPKITGYSPNAFKIYNPNCIRLVWRTIESKLVFPNHFCLIANNFHPSHTIFISICIRISFASLPSKLCSFSDWMWLPCHKNRRKLMKLKAKIGYVFRGRKPPYIPLLFSLTYMCICHVKDYCLKTFSCLFWNWTNSWKLRKLENFSSTDIEFYVEICCVFYMHFEEIFGIHMIESSW